MVRQIRDRAVGRLPPPATVRKSFRASRLPPQKPGVARGRRDEERDERSRESVRVLDQRGEVEWGEQASVAQRPMVAAAHPGPGDPHDGAEDDEQVGAGGGGPCEPREASRHEARNVYSRSEEHTSELQSPMYLV